MAAMMSMRRAATRGKSGGGFTTPVRAVRGFRPAKKQGHAIALVVWGAKHGASKHAKGPQVVPMEVIGDWKKLERRRIALTAAG